MKSNDVERISEALSISTQQAEEQVTSQLSTCALTSPQQVRGLGECHGRCLLDEACVALTYSREGECFLCFVVDGSSVESLVGFPGSRVMVSVAIPQEGGL